MTAEADESPRYPVFLDLRGRLAVVVGGTSAAERKARSLVKHGADVVVVSPTVSDELITMEADGLITVEARGYVRGDLEGAFIAICAADSEEVRRAVFAEAAERGTLVNVVGSPELCSFVIPSVLRRGALQIAVSTGGVSPETARLVKHEIAALYGPVWESYAQLMGGVRALLLRTVPDDADARAAVFTAIAKSDLLARLSGGAEPTAEQVVAEFGTKSAAGGIWNVGADE